MVPGIESKNFASELVIPGYEKNSTIYWLLIQSTHTLLENTAPGLQSIAIYPVLQQVFKRLFHCSIKPAASDG